MAEQIIAHPRAEVMVGYLSSVLASIHSADPRSLPAEGLVSAEIRGCSRHSRSRKQSAGFSTEQTEEDIAVIQAYAGYADPVAKAWSYFSLSLTWGSSLNCDRNLKEAILSIHTEGDQTVAGRPRRCFRPAWRSTYESDSGGSREVSLQSSSLCAIGISIKEPYRGFLSRFVNLFPDETYDLLIRRIDQGKRAKENNQQWFRLFRLVHQNISFVGVPADKRFELGRDCIARLVASDSAEEVADLFWDVVGYDEPALRLILEIAPHADERGVLNIAALIGKAIPRLAFTNTAFAKDLLRNFTGEQRERLVDAFARQARRFGSKRICGKSRGLNGPTTETVRGGRRPAFPDEAGLEDLASALRRFT